MLERRFLKNFDVSLCVVTLALVFFGCAMIYSAMEGGSAGASYAHRQILWALIGLVAGVVVASIDHSIYKLFAGKLYVLNLILLGLVLKLGQASKGAQRWIGFGPVHIQPSEFAKLIMIIALAVFLVRRLDTIASFKTFALSFVYIAVPMLLIFKQPDLSTSLVLIAVWITMVFIMGTDVKNILIVMGVGVVLMGVAWHVPGLLKDYQKQRVISFVNPAGDPLGSGYHVTQSRIAIGSGKLSGKGFLKGTQRKLRFIPEQHTDFIFAVVGEETGFVGSAGLLGLYLILLWRALTIMALTEDPTGRAIAAGIVGMFLFQILVNVGMTVGIMPVTGVPLPLVSYGGSSLMSSLMCVGLLQGISLRRHKISF